MASRPNRVGVSAVLLCFVMLSAVGLSAQGALNLTNTTLAINNNGQSGASLDVVAGQLPINVYRMGAAARAAGTYDVQVWYRHGGFSTGYPPTAASGLQQTGWVMAGAGTATFTVVGQVEQLPIDINQTIQPNQRLGLAAVFTTGSLCYWSVTTAPTATVVSDANISIEFHGIGGSYVATPPAGAHGHAASFYPRGLLTTVWYDIAQIPGQNAELDEIRLNNNTGPMVGNNTVEAVIKNIGTVALDNVPIPMQYSTDGGTTWSVSQTFTIPSFAPLTSQTVSFTTPWNIPSMASVSLGVRIDPAIGQGNALLTRDFNVDADIDLIDTNPPPTLTAPLAVQATIKNNGEWNLNGVPINLRYSITGGVTWVTQTFTPTTLAANNDTETFTFTQTITLSLGNSTTVDVEIFPQVPGDVDTSDADSLLIPDQSIIYPLALQDPSTAFTSGGAANCNRGWMFVVNVPNKVVKRLGCWYPDSTTDSKTVSLWHITSPEVLPLVPATNQGSAPGGLQGTIIAQVNSTPGPGWCWTDLTTPVPLQQGERYIITAHTVTQSYYFGSTSATTNPSWFLSGPQHPIEFLGTYYNNSSPPSTLSTSLIAGSHYGVVDIGYGDANIPGNHIIAEAAQVGGGGAVVGSNTVEAVLKNFGTVDHSNQPVTVKYSTDGGVTWSAPQTFSFPSFGPLMSVTATFTAPWTIPTIGNYNLQVQIDPPIGTGSATASTQVQPNPVIDSISLSHHPAQLNVPMVVRADVKNEGQFNLTGIPIPMRYRLDNGPWVTENITPTDLQVGQSQLLSFTQTVTFPVQGTYVIEVEVFPLLPGDTGTTGKSASDSWSDIGILWAYAYENHTSGPNSIPWGTPTSSWPPPFGYQVLYQPTDLNEIGFIESVGQLYATSGTMAYNRIKIWIGESTFSAGAGITTNYFANYNVAPPTLCFDGPFTLTVPPGASSASPIWANIPLTTPYLYMGQNNLVVTWELLDYTGTQGFTIRYMTGIPHTYRLYGPVPVNGIDLNNPTTTGTLGTGFATSTRFGMSPPYDPGLEVSRVGGGPIPPGGTDMAGVVNTANHNNTMTFNMANRGVANNLNVTNLTVTDQTNCTASLVGAPPTSVPFGGTPVPFSVEVNPSPGPYSFKITVTSNNADPLGNPYVVTVSGDGFVNTAPQVDVVAPLPLQASGVMPNFQIEGVMGDSLASAIRGIDVDGHQELTVVITEGTGGTISAAAAGFTNSFPITLPAGSPPNAANMTGTAAAAGTVVFDVSVLDNGVFPLSSVATVTYRIGARVDVDTMNADSLFVRVSGVKDFYRGETGRPISMTMSNPNPFPVELQSMTFLPRVKATQTLLTGFTFNVAGTPLTIPANASNMAVSATMDIDANASGANGVTVELVLDSALAEDPVNPVTNPIVVKILDPIDEFDLYDGPVPQPMLITMTAFQPAVETVPFLQDLTVSGGLGNYTWSVAPGSASGLPNGLTLNPNGNQFLPASIQGTPTAGSSNNSPYLITLRVSDTAYQADITLSMVVSPLLPLSLAPVTMPQGQEFVAYPGVTLQAAGGSQIYTYGVDFNSQDPLPAGLTLNPQTGQISGTPADQTQGNYSITFEVSDGIGSIPTTTTLEIIPHPLQWRSNTIAGGEETVAYSEFLDAIGGTGARIFSIQNGALPTGLSLNPVSGEISGTPAQNTAGSYPVTFRVTDGANVTADETVTVGIAVPPPLTITTNHLSYASIGTTFNQTISATGGSRNYTFSVGTGTLAVPNSVTLSNNGELSATPERGEAGRYPLTVIVNDGYNTVSKALDVVILDEGADQLSISEIDVSQGYIEISNLSSDPVDLSGWSVTAWVDGNSPVAFAFDTLPGATLALPGEVVTLNIGGTAGGSWPTYATGTGWSATASSNLAVALYDRFGSALDFVAVGTANPSSLQDASSNPADLPDFITSSPSIPNGSANHSLTTVGWSSGAVGSHLAYNAGLTAVPLQIVRTSFRAAIEGETYWDFALAVGGVKPYTWSISAISAPWLTIDPQTGELGGTVPNSGGSFTVSVTVTDANSTQVTNAAPFRIYSPLIPPAHTVTIGQGGGQAYEGSVSDVPVQYSKGATAADLQKLGFVVQLPQTTADQVAIHRVVRAPGLPQDLVVRSRDIGSNRVYVMIESDNNAVIPTGDVAVLQYIVPIGGGDAQQGLYDIEVTEILAESATTKHRVEEVDGSVELSNYHPADVNRDTVINVIDVQRCVNLILSLATESYPGEGDANLDTIVNVVDVQNIVNCILNGNCTTP